MVNLIGDQFVQNKYDKKAEDEKILRVVQAANEQKEKEQQARERARKAKEMEAKYYQDNQVLAKRSIQELRKV